MLAWLNMGIIPLHLRAETCKGNCQTGEGELPKLGWLQAVSPSNMGGFQAAAHGGYTDRSFGSYRRFLHLMGESPWLYAGGRPTKAWAVYYLKRGQLQAGRLRLMCCGPWAVGLSLGSCRRSSSLMGGLLGCLRGVLPTQLGRSSYLIGGPS